MNGTNRITIDNTLDERLRLLEDSVCEQLSPLFWLSSFYVLDVARDQKRLVWREPEPQILYIIALKSMNFHYHLPFTFPACSLVYQRNSQTTVPLHELRISISLASPVA